MRKLEELTWFRLSPDRDAHGLSCGAEGAFFGPVPLLARSEDGGKEAWAPRPIAEINAELSEAFGLPIDMAAKAGGLAAIAGGLNRRDMAFAQIATVQLRLPDLPPLAKSARTDGEVARLAVELFRAGILRGAFDPAKHPKWPAGAPDSQGGLFRPRDSDGSAERTNDSGALLADATAPSVLGRDGIPDNLPAHVKDGLEFLESKINEPQNAQYREFYNKWKIIYSDSPPDFGPSKHSLGQTIYSPDGSLTVFYPDAAKGWTPEKYRFFVAHEFAHTLPENAATPPRERERNANEIAARITGIPIPEEFRSYAKRNTINAPRG